jgi:hypothetical protein
MPKNAPPGSAAIAILPTSMTSIGSIMTWPPASLILRAVSPASAEAIYVVQVGGISAGPIFGPMPATGLPSSSAMQYPPDSGAPSWISQPNRPL